jgi:hypothetical protein
MNNDKAISSLQEKIALKRGEMGQEPKFEPVTSCSIMMGTGKHLDIKNVTQDILVSLLVDLNSKRMSADDLGIPYEIGSYPVTDWVADIQSAIACLEYEQEGRRLKSLEHRLEGLLSEDSRKERAIKAIADEVDA